MSMCVPLCVIMNDFFNFIDPVIQRLIDQAERRQATALRPGTQANRRSVLVKFIKFLSSPSQASDKSSDSTS